jgi:hypothetical protein
MAKRRGQPAPRELGVYITFEQIFFQKARNSDMDQFLSAIPIEQALKFFAAVSAMVYNFRGSSFFEFQKGLVRELSSGNPYSARIIERLEHPNAFVTLEQVAVLQKFSMMYCAPEGSPIPEDFNNRLLRVMLAYNSMRGLEDIDPKDREKAMLTTELRNMFSSHELTGFLVDLYWRFFKWAQGPEAAKSEHYLDVNTDFQTFYGMTFMDYAAAAFAFLSHQERRRLRLAARSHVCEVRHVERRAQRRTGCRCRCTFRERREMAVHG